MSRDDGVLSEETADSRASETVSTQCRQDVPDAGESGCLMRHYICEGGINGQDHVFDYRCKYLMYLNSIENLEIACSLGVCIFRFWPNTFRHTFITIL